MKKTRQSLENECSILTTSNENEIVRLTKLQEETEEEQSKFVELSQIVEQKGSKNRFEIFVFLFSRCRYFQNWTKNI